MVGCGGVGQGVIQGECALQQRRFLSTVVRQGQDPLMENLSLMIVKSVTLDFGQYIETDKTENGEN